MVCFLSAEEDDMPMILTSIAVMICCFQCVADKVPCKPALTNHSNERRSSNMRLVAVRNLGNGTAKQGENSPVDCFQ